MQERLCSQKQWELLQMWRKGKLKRLNFLIGSVRSGKTFASLMVWALFVAAAPQGAHFMMCGKTLISLQRNCLMPLLQIVGKRNFKYSLSKKEGILFGRHIYLEGACDSRAESKIRGMTLYGAYCDELTLFEFEFFNMLLSRLSSQGAKLFATSNPDCPQHWVKAEFLDKRDELDLMVMEFRLTDNTFLDKAYIDNIKAEYSGVFYERFILGSWVAAEGVIFPNLCSDMQSYMISASCVPRLKYIHIGVDFGGNKSNHAFVACGVTADADKLYVLKSESICAKGMTVAQMIAHFVRFAREVSSRYGEIDLVYADSAEQAIINELRARTSYAVHNAFKNRIIDRIRWTDLLLSSRKIAFVEQENDALLQGLCQARWDTTVDGKRLDDGSSDIDVLDAFEYGFEPLIWELLEDGLYVE